MNKNDIFRQYIGHILSEDEKYAMSERMKHIQNMRALYMQIIYDTNALDSVKKDALLARNILQDEHEELKRALKLDAEVVRMLKGESV